MASCIISFSGRKDGNCAAIARTLLGALAGEARCFGFSALRRVRVRVLPGPGGLPLFQRPGLFHL